VEDLSAMRIITFRTISEFVQANKDAEIALGDWYKKTVGADWTCFADMKLSFNSVVAVGNKRYVFNIKGNSYRLIALILFKAKIVFIRKICSHAEYDKIDDCSRI